MKRYVVAAVLAAVLSSPASAGGAPTPKQLCGTEHGSVAALTERVVKGEKHPEVFRGPDYLAYEDKQRETMWSFTTEKQPAHPAAVCRRPVRQGDELVLDMGIVCEGPKDACDKLTKDFEYLNYQMLLQMRQQQQK